MRDPQKVCQHWRWHGQSGIDKQAMSSGHFPIQTPTPARAKHAALPRRGKPGRARSLKGTACLPFEFSKMAHLLDLINGAEGATSKEILATTQGQTHSVRGLFSGSLGKKMGLKTDSNKREDGERGYETA
jgi:hypothetical protein